MDATAKYSGEVTVVSSILTNRMVMSFEERHYILSSYHNLLVIINEEKHKAILCHFKIDENCGVE